MAEGLQSKVTVKLLVKVDLIERWEEDSTVYVWSPVGNIVVYFMECGAVPIRCTTLTGSLQAVNQTDCSDLTNIVVIL